MTTHSNRQTSSISCRRLATMLALSWIAAASASAEWLSLGSKAVTPTVFSKSGIGTTNAVAEARITRKDIDEWCSNWVPDDKDCAKEQLAQYDLKKVYRASADCKAGRIVAVDGDSYTLAGVWDHRDVIAEGRTKWRDKDGNIVGADNASGGLGISQQWEVLCPGPPPAAAPAAGSGGAATTPPTPDKGFSVGFTLTNPFRR